MYRNLRIPILRSLPNVRFQNVPTSPPTDLEITATQNDLEIIAKRPVAKCVEILPTLSIVPPDREG